MLLLRPSLRELVFAFWKRPEKSGDRISEKTSRVVAIVPLRMSAATPVGGRCWKAGWRFPGRFVPWVGSGRS